MPGPHEPAAPPAHDVHALRLTAPALARGVASPTPRPVDDEDGGGLDDLYDIARLARRLGVEHATIRVWLSRKVPWLPPPDGRLNGGAVWRATTLEGVEERRFRGRPGRKPRYTTPPREHARTGSLPIVPAPAAVTTTGALPAVAASTATGQLPVVPHRTPLGTATGQLPVVAPADRAPGRHAAPAGDPQLPA